MLPLPQHPIHYIFGCITHAPYVFEAWVHEKIEIKTRLFLFYAFSYIGMAITTPGLGFLDLFGIYILATSIMAIPIFIFSMKKKGFALKASDAFFNAVLAYHAFFLAFFLLFNVSMFTSHFFGGWTINNHNIIMSIAMMMLSGFSLQMAWTDSKSFPWSLVWFFSLLLGILAYWAFSSAI